MSSVNQRIFGRFLYGSSGSTLTDVIVESSRDRIPNTGSLAGHPARHQLSQWPRKIRWIVNYLFWRRELARVESAGRKI